MESHMGHTKKIFTIEIPQEKEEDQISQFAPKSK